MSFLPVYINGIGLISPQKTAETKDFLTDIVEYTSDYLKCIDPNYKSYIEPLAARRMSRMIKMGIAAARMALADAGCGMPDAIITGTGLGSVEDTEKILGSMVTGETLLNPTPFMQSTYNTISSQIAITLKCHGYNSTYVHRTFSFESGLFDGLMQIAEKSAANVLAGGIDEMTLVHLNIVRRLGDFKMLPESNLGILDYKTPGAIAGEGSGFFLLGKDKKENTYCTLSGVKTFYKPQSYLQSAGTIHSFLESHGVEIPQLDLVILGLNGDKTQDSVYGEIAGLVYPGVPQAYYKHLCGEYHTSSAFALWMAANILKRQSVPPAVQLRPSANPGAPIRNVLIHNHYRNINHSLILLSAQI
jgi:3-oxoacyl-(acyl-carrier-protein) synthase